MPRHTGASQFHDGALKARSRKSRKARGRKRQSWRDKAAHAEAAKRRVAF